MSEATPREALQIVSSKNFSLARLQPRYFGKKYAETFAVDGSGDAITTAIREMMCVEIQIDVFRIWRL